jgi:protein-tyrosine phosphatase
MAEAILKHKVAAGPLRGRVKVDSAGTGDWHEGQLPNPRTRKVCSVNGITANSLARQVNSLDFRDFDLIIAMDRQNYRDLLAWPGSVAEKVHLMRDWLGEPETDVPDPYYGNESDFEYCFDLLSRSCDALYVDLMSRFTTDPGTI